LFFSLQSTQSKESKHIDSYTEHLPEGERYLGFLNVRTLPTKRPQDCWFAQSVAFIYVGLCKYLLRELRYSSLVPLHAPAPENPELQARGAKEGERGSQGVSELEWRCFWK